MELKMKQITLPEAIEFNFEELKQEVEERTASYVGLVYTEDQIREAKRDLANLRKFTKALSDERIKVKKELMKPYMDFEGKIKELSSIVDNAIKSIDDQVKGFEEQKKAEKMKEIERIFDDIALPEGMEWLMLERLFDIKWLNASVSLKKIQAEIKERVDEIKQNVDTLKNLPEFGFEAMEAYKITLNLAEAIDDAKKIAEIQVAKAAHEAETKPVAIEQAKQEERQKEWVSFRALLSYEDATELRKFFLDRNIEFGVV